MKQASHKRANTVKFHLYEISEVVKSIKVESRMVVTRGYGDGELGSCSLMDIEFQFCKMKGSGDLFHNNVTVHTTNELFTLKNN